MNHFATTERKTLLKWHPLGVILPLVLQYIIQTFGRS